MIFFVCKEKYFRFFDEIISCSVPYILRFHHDALSAAVTAVQNAICRLNPPV